MKSFGPVLINDIWLLESQGMKRVRSRVWTVIAILNYSLSCLIKSSKECPGGSLTEEGNGSSSYKRNDSLTTFEES